MFLSSHGQVLSDPNFWIFFIIALFILLHILFLIIIIPQWLLDAHFDPKKKKEKEIKLKSMANELGLENKTVYSLKNLNLFSWLVYKKRVRDYYVPYIREIGKIEGDILKSRKKVTPDSIPRYFYGALFSEQPLSDILCTKNSVDPYIMVATQRSSQGKSTIFHRVIHFRSYTLGLPKCAVSPTHEWIDSISPEPDDINFISDEKFSKKFDLTGENQLRIRKIFNQEIRAIMVNNSKWTWKLENHSILIKYLITVEDLNQMNDIKPSLIELSKLYKILQSTDITSPSTREQIEADILDEIIDKKLYKKRMVIFACLLLFGAFLVLLALFMLIGFFIKIKFPFLFYGLFLGLVGFALFQYGKSEWVRNKNLKKEGKVEII